MFGFSLLAVELFALLPTLHRSLQQKYQKYVQSYSHTTPVPVSVYSAGTLAVTAITLLAVNSHTATVAFVCLLLTVTLLCPVILHRLHAYKLHMSGPWDIAHVEVTDVD